MADRSKHLSAQTRSVLVALAAEPGRQRHGYELAKETGLKSGTLYPILIRLAERGLVVACWEEEQPAGRPRRHLYRLTEQGVLAASLVAQPVSAQSRSAARVRPRRIAPEGAS
jgi:PadR family transcriptional regulator PadR